MLHRTIKGGYMEYKIPKVGEYERNVGTLIAIDVVTPPPPEIYNEYIFEVRTARCELRLNSEVVKTMQELNDFYGIGTGEKTAIKEMKEYAAKRNITAKSELEVVVIRVLEQTRMRPTQTENYSAKGYSDFEYLSSGSKRGLPEPLETIVWSSKSG